MSSTLAALMVAGCGTMTFAKNYDDVKNDHSAKTEISILSDIGVIKGTSSNEFSPEDDVTREQMAALLFRLMLGRDDAGRVNTSNFKDLYEPYYNGAISWANAAGYIIGTSKDTFEPTGGITKQDAMTMLVRALGQESAKMNDGYPWSYINAAIKLGLDRGLDNVAYDQTLTRAETAVILYNALTSEYLIGKTTSNGNVYYESTSIIEEVFGYSMTEAVLVSTNDYTTDSDTVVKNGYITLLGSDENGKNLYMTVPYSEMNLDGEANDHLGESFKVIYSGKSGKYSVLSAVPMTETKSFENVKVDDDRKTVEIGGVKYTVVDKYSDELSTNNNELMLYAYDDDGRLEQVQDLKELKELLGFYRITLMYNNGSDTARRGIIKVFEMNTLKIDEDGRINIADNKKKADLNVSNEAKAEEGDFVLYYYNAKTKELHIAKTLDYVTGTVKRITSTSVKIGDDTYELGNKTAGITAESIRAKLELGTSVTVVVHNDAVVAVPDSVVSTNSSEYLAALSDAYRVYENGSFRYVMTAFINGEEKNIYVNDGDAEKGKVYRYTKTTDVYKLISPSFEDGIIVSGKSEFIQNSGGLDEIAYLIDSAKNTTIEQNGRSYYTIKAGDAESASSVAGLSDVRFVCDKNTVIVVNDNGKIMQRSGAYASTIEVKDGANVVAVFNNEVGSVETLRYLYIGNGKLGNYDLDASFVRVLAVNGLVYENGRSYVEYTVFNFGTGKIENRLSTSDSLEIGKDYRCGNDETVTDDRADLVMSGFVTGYTSGTVTVDNTTFPFASDMEIIRITADNKIEKIKLAELYMRNIEFVTDNGKIKLIIESSEAKFTASYKDNKITISPDFDLTSFKESRLSVTKLEMGDESINLSGTAIGFGADNTIEITLPATTALAEGKYTVTFKIGNSSFVAELTVEKTAEPEQPEQPEKPEKPDQPEQPDQPENPEKPENPDQPENPEQPEKPENPDNGSDNN